MNRKAFRPLVLVVAFCLILGSTMSAQQITASLRGKVADVNGSVIPNAKVTATQTDTNFSKSVTAGSLGQYYLGGLPAGHYQVQIEAPGFAKLVRNVDLTVGLEAGLDFAMQVGSVNTQVDVTAEAQLVEPTKTDIGSTITKAQVDNLPTINRDFSSLALLVPGVTPGVGGNGASLAINGQRGYQNNVFVDGVSNQWQYYGRQASTLSQDWIQEFQVMTNSYSAEFGTASGGILNVLTRSGTNDWHGRGYFFYRNKAFDANPFAGTFDNNNVNQPQFLTSDQVPDYSQWRWGVSAGGPIIKDKLFIFGGFEKLDLDSTAQLAISDYWRAQGYQTVLPIATTDRPFLLRGDYNVNNTNHVSVRFDRTIQKSVNEGGPFQVQDGRDTFGGPVWNLVGNLTTTVNNTNLNEFRVGYMSNMPPIICNQSGTGGTEELQKGPPGTYANINYPTLTIGCPIFDGTEGEQDLKLADTYSLIKGRHQFKFGADFRHNVLNDNITNFHEGYWNFGQDKLFDINDPTTYPFEFIGNVGQNAFKIPIWNYSLFAQDTWRITDRVTLDLGIRYDVDQSATAGNQFVDAKNTAVINQYGGTAPLQKTQVDYNNVSPRLGVVWAPTADRRTTLHAAFGFFYDQNHGNFNAIYIINTLVSNGLNVVNCNSPVTNPYYSQPNGVATCKSTLAASFPFFPTFPGANSTQGLDTLDPNLQIPRTVQYTAGVAHEFQNGLMLSADFVRSNGSGIEGIDQVHQLSDGTIVENDPRFSNIDRISNVGYVHYTALEIQGKYRRHRVNLEASYTLSKAYSDLVSGSVFGSAPTNSLDLSQDAGPDATDQRHNFVLSGAYDLPWGFQVAGIGTYRSPLPWSVVTNDNPTGAFYPPRPEPKGSRRGDDFKGVDLRVTKVFKLKERFQPRVFWEMYNMFNSLNYISYDTLRESTTFGLPTAASDMRRQQLGVRIDF